MNHYTNLTDLHAAYGFPPPENPMISVLCDAVRDVNFGSRVVEHTSDFYIIAFKKMKSGALTYGRTKYDHASGSMFFVSPRQILALDDIEREVKGFLMYFHEDFLTVTHCTMKSESMASSNMKQMRRCTFHRKKKKSSKDCFVKLILNTATTRMNTAATSCYRILIPF